MPAFIKTKKDEKIWARAKSRVREQYPNISENSDKFWALTTTIYKNMNRGNNSMRKSASGVFARLMAKKAYVPLTAAAQEAMAGQQAAPQDPNMQGGQPMDPSMHGQDPSMMQQGGAMPQMPMDPSMMQGQDPSMQGGQQMPPIPVVSGPNGEPVDAETGFIVVDFAQGIEQDPNSGLLMNKFTGEFMTPDGQPIPPEQAMQMMGQGGQPMDPSMQGQDPSMMQQGGQPVDPNMMAAQQGGQPMMQQQASAEYPMDMMGGQGMPAGQPPMQGNFNESAGMQIDPNTGMPIDPNTGMLIDPSTGGMIDPSTGQPVQGGSMMGGDPSMAAAQLLAAVPGLEEFLNIGPKQMEKLDKDMGKVVHDVSNMRTDLQRMDRNLVAAKDEMRTLYDRMDNCLATVEDIVAGLAGGQPQDPAMMQQAAMEQGM